MAKQYETVIGLEVHVELATATKIFCGCSTKFGAAPNTHTCPVCTGMPGSLPVLNKKVVEYALALGMAANCEINRYCRFDRKNYFYPDNPQNYQISQLYLPICINGHVEIETAGGKKNVGIHEIHMEEDAGKLVHDDWADCSLVDYNRSGVPLIEIVSEPDMRSADEVIAYLEKLRMTIQYLGASDCKLNEGSMRADVNLSVREVGASEFGTRTEMKNLNSFKAIARAIEGNVPAYAFLIKMLLTALTLAAGYKGGEIVPAFFTGATFGCLFGHIFGISPSLCAATGMLALFCGVTNCPIASMLIGFELFGFEGVSYILIAISISYMLSGYHGLYKEQIIVYSKYHPKFINRLSGDERFDGQDYE